MNPIRRTESSDNYQTNNIIESFNNNPSRRQLNFTTPNIKKPRVTDIDTASIFTPVSQRLQSRRKNTENGIDSAIETFTGGVFSPSTNTRNNREDAATALQANIRMKLGKLTAKKTRAAKTLQAAMRRTQQSGGLNTIRENVENSALSASTPNTRAFAGLSPLTSLPPPPTSTRSRVKTINNTAASTLQAAMRRIQQKDTFAKKSHAAYERGRDNRLTSEAKRNPIKTDADLQGESYSYRRGYKKEKLKTGPKSKQDKDK
jgi:hypothetical protein